MARPHAVVSVALPGYRRVVPPSRIRHRPDVLVPSIVDMTLGLDTLKQPIRAHLVPGQIDEVALVVAGVHGSE